MFNIGQKIWILIDAQGNSSLWGHEPDHMNHPDFKDDVIVKTAIITSENLNPNRTDQKDV